MESNKYSILETENLRNVDTQQYHKNTDVKFLQTWDPLRYGNKLFRAKRSEDDEDTP